MLLSHEADQRSLEVKNTDNQMPHGPCKTLSRATLLFVYTNDSGIFFTLITLTKSGGHQSRADFHKSILSPTETEVL